MRKLLATQPEQLIAQVGFVDPLGQLMEKPLLKVSDVMRKSLAFDADPATRFLLDFASEPLLWGKAKPLTGGGCQLFDSDVART